MGLFSKYNHRISHQNLTRTTATTTLTIKGYSRSSANHIWVFKSFKEFWDI
jgi:hypothetical protein